MFDIVLIRTHLIKSLYCNLLGPKYGNKELIEEPFLKYELGILNSSFSLNSNAEQKILDSEIKSDPTEINYEELVSPKIENTQNSDNLRQEIDTELNLKSGALSLGLSFVVEGDSPKFKICVTWARYLQDKQLDSIQRMFQRYPNFFETEYDIKNLQNHKVEELKVGMDRGNITHPGIFLHIFKNKIKNTKWIIKIFLENKTEYDTAKNQTEEHRIFQPQIRVKLYDSKLADLYSDHQFDHMDYDSDDLLYLNYRTKARGYLCAAIWDEIDPEKDQKSEIGKMSWPDLLSVPNNIRNIFVNPSVRTEYLPSYTILQPDQNKKSTFSASILSQSWNIENIDDHLRSIPQNYRDWIESQKSILSENKNSGIIDERLKLIGDNNIQHCIDTNKRIEAGIDFLKTNEKARAAFCFMNAVMNDKRQHEENEFLDWREFQMAFILQSLKGVSGESEKEREITDVLWFPTGGGKTEAYLGIVIFAIAYRRLSLRGKFNNDGGISVISRYTLRLLTIQQFQRALGAIIAADIRRVENWLPEDAKEGSRKISDPYMLKRFEEGSLWGNQRFSIGMWIGNEITPKDFCYVTGKKGKVFLNCEGALLSQLDRRRRFSEEKGDPAQIQTCPVCKNILCLSKEQKNSGTKTLTWIINSPKLLDELKNIPKKEFENSNMILKENPKFVFICDSLTGKHYYRLTMKITSTRSIDRQSVDSWWSSTVKLQLDPNEDNNPLESTAPSMPGYFFLHVPGSRRPHDFIIFCTNKECKLNNTKWFEKIEGKYDALIPEPFQINNSPGISRSVPISAFTSDEQIYFKCPSLLIATVDKFANLPFEPKCSSLFGNVDVVHSWYGYGRRITFEAPIQQTNNNQRISIKPSELDNILGFNPPSLILQDELHLIEGPLGSMVGIYEMAVDVLSNDGARPKYIASSATIKESKSQVGTIFRRDVDVFPPSGINSSDNYFSKIEEDVGCVAKQAGRLYLGMSSTKSTVTLPIKAQSIIMSKIFKIKSNPENYNLTEYEKNNLQDEIEQYWTFVSYFTDLQILAKFTNYYSENIIDYVSKWSSTKMFNSIRSSHNSIKPGLRLFPITFDRNMKISNISIYCGNAIGKVKIALYKNGDPIGYIIHKFEYQNCEIGENIFELPVQYDVKNKEKIWIAVINDSENTCFETVSITDDSLESINNVNGNFPNVFKKPHKFSGNPIKLSLNSSSRQLQEKNNIQLSSETKSEDLARNLERLKSSMEVDSLQTSPVFGTGIDIDRLGLMEIMNQPKTNSGYIQSSGRVGRTKPGLVINWLRAGRARDLNHYENFIGYHRMLHRFVEPVTASPFSDEAMKLCLGPIIVAILRNARSILDNPISTEWITDTGTYRMHKHSNDPEMIAIEKILEKISSSEFIAEFRRMQKKHFKNLFGKSKGNWHEMAKDLRDDTTSFTYAERRPHVKLSNNVVLGTPNHTDLGLEVVYEDTPNSLRQTESTSTFYKSSVDTVQIRPSQFITKYGPGTLISRKTSTWVIPSLKELVYNLKDKGNFVESNTLGNRELYKYEIKDSRMKRIIRRFNPKINWEKLRFFSMPTNSSLTIEDFQPVYHCNEFPKWAICHNRLHSSKKILAETSYNNNILSVKCPECARLSGNEYSTEFYSVRYVLACKNGHLGDLNWEFEVHRSTGSHCSGKVFEWITSDNNDNVEIACLGHWDQNTNSFILSNCHAYTTYFDLKIKSMNGQIDCTAKFAESGNDPNGCSRINGVSQAKIVSKTQMSIRMPVIMTTMEIQRYKGILFELYIPLAQLIDTFVSLKPNYKKDDFIQHLEAKKGKIKGITNNLIRQTRTASDSVFDDVIEEIKKFVITMDTREGSLTEYQSLEEELSSLENQTRDNGMGVQVGPYDPPTDVRFPIQFSVFGINFEAMPFGDIKVTQIQSGYTREISPPTVENSQVPTDEQNDGRRIGDIVSFSAKFTDENDNTWYLANQLRGEGIFIHFDPKQHKNVIDVFDNSDSVDFKKWKNIHEQTIEKNTPIIKRIQNKKDKQKDIDDLEMENVHTNPLFVWWHSFAHELINQLSIDSGFMGVSLGERVYCVQKSNGNYSAGIFIYASSPGTDGTLGGLTSLVDKNILPRIIEKTLMKICNCSNDPVCSNRQINDKRRTGAACHICLMNSETSCSYRNRFLDRNLVLNTL